MPEVYADLLYVEARKRDDPGTVYFHEFKPGARIIGRPDGSLTVRSSAGRRLWNYFDTEDDGMTTFLENPRGRRRRRDSRGRFIKAGRSRRKTTRRRRRRNPHTFAAVNKPRRARRRRTMAARKRRNPRRSSIGGGAVMTDLTKSFQVAGGMITSDILVGYLSRWLPALSAGMTKRASKAGVGLLLSTVGPRLLGASTAHALAQGAFAGVVLDLAQEYLYPSLGVPVSLASYVELPAGMDAYLTDGGNAGPVMENYGPATAYTM